MHGRMHPNLGHVTILFAHELFFSPSAYPMITHTYPVARNFPIKTWLLGDSKQGIIVVTQYIY